jgi:hypothetical protein
MQPSPSLLTSSVGTLDDFDFDPIGMTLSIVATDSSQRTSVFVQPFCGITAVIDSFVCKPIPENSFIDVKAGFKVGVDVIKSCSDSSNFAFWNAVLIMELCP